MNQGETQVANIAAEDLTALTDSLHRLLQDRCTEADVRRTMETPAGYDPALWAQLAEMGLVGLVIDEAYGGVGAGPIELERVMEEAGATLLCSPLISSAVLAAGLIQALGDEATKTRLLPTIADGSKIATVALAGPNGGWTAGDVAVAAAGAGEAWTLNGTASFVTHGQVADVILVVAKATDGLAVVALAGEQAGGAKRTLEFTVDYAKTRAQFGRLIGGFQAIKHMAADLLLESESATSAARAAARSLADGGKDAPAAISLAAFACADAFNTITATAIQMHGGIAFTWAHPAHLYLRRARADAQLFGTPAAYRERYLQALGA